MRSSPDVRSEFARSLPKEILSELVIVMSELPTPTTPARKTVKVVPPMSTANPVYQSIYQPINPVRPIEIDAEQPRPHKRSRKSDVGVMNGGLDDEFEVKPFF